MFRLFLGGVALPAIAGRAAVIYQTDSAYHHIQVIDQGGTRTLSFNGSSESRMSLRNPLAGHFEYTEYFHLPWLWNNAVTNGLMIGLGGGSTQKAFQSDYPAVHIETAELDPVVAEVARRYFGVSESPNLKITVEDGRVFLRRSRQVYDLIIIDAYTTTRYGSSMPPHLTTREFFQLARDRLTTNGVLACNVIGRVQGWRSGFVAAMHRTLSTVFPQVYVFPVRESMNVVFVATVDPTRRSLPQLVQEAARLHETGRLRRPGLPQRLGTLTEVTVALGAPVLTDDYAPVEGMLGRDSASPDAGKK